MNLRKEPVLLLLTLLVGAYVYKGIAADDYTPPRLKTTAVKYEPQPVTPALLADDKPIPVARTVARELWREPSETQPLPPVALPFPPRAQLSLAALPLPLGPDYGHLHALRLPGDPVEGVQLAAAPAAAPAPAAPTAEPEASPQDKNAQWARIYDRVWPAVGEPFFGRIEAPGIDLFDLEARTDFGDVKFRLHVFSTSRGVMTQTITFEPGPQQPRKVQLADTLRNEIERRKRKIPTDRGHLDPRAQFIEWLLQQSRQELWVYDVAMAQAQQYVKDAGEDDVEGQRWLLRVLRAKGDLNGELQLLQGLGGRHANSSFQHEGLGLLYQKLGLDGRAETELRAAVDLAPTDARPRASLAAFLHERHRPKEAIEQALRAFAGINGAPAPDRARIATVVVGCQLAAGDVAGARASVQAAGEAASPLLRAGVDYASGQAQAALDGFAAAAAAGEGAQATLGQAACMLWLGHWQDAQTALEAVADQAPLLRHRAYTGLALLCLRIGQRDQAMGHLDRALEASPHDTYAHYLRARTLREQGQLAAARDELDTTLRAHDDFVHAIAEMAVLRAQMAREGAAAQQAENSVAAVRYGDRAVDLARPPVLELLELQGVLHFDAADLEGARGAFQAAVQLASDDNGRLLSRAALALCDYAQGGVEEARSQLTRMTTDLPKEVPMKAWAEATLERIDDHSQKEQFDDRFDRQELGKVWKQDRDGTLGASIVDGQLAFVGKASKPSSVVLAERDGAVKKAGNFLAVEARLLIGKDHARNDGFAGMLLELQKPQGSAQSDFSLKYGVRDGKPFWRLQDGRNPPVQAELKVADFDLDKPQRLQVRVVPIGDQGRQFGLLLLWNGQPVLDEPRKLERLDKNSPGELRTCFVVESGKREAPVDVRFDEYHLERRKEN